MDSPPLLGADALTVWTAVYPLAAAGTLGVLVKAALYAKGQLAAVLGQAKELEIARHAQTLLVMSQRWDTEPTLHESREALRAYLTPHDLEVAVRQMYGSHDPALGILLKVTSFYEELGVLVSQRALSFDMVDEWLGELIRDHWIKWAPTVAFVRSSEGLGRERLASNWEKLARRVGESRGLAPVVAEITTSREG
jgi:hypothetical protein